jgi:hypothetical protein
LRRAWHGRGVGRKADQPDCEPVPICGHNRILASGFSAVARRCG